MISYKRPAERSAEAELVDLNREAAALLASEKPLTFGQELTVTLSQLDKEAEALGAHDVRTSIADVFGDMTLPAGKENAALAIHEIRGKLEVLSQPSANRKHNRRPAPQTGISVAAAE